ncbi:unnamed protein product [Staurois parvus]|uniref:Uncharacterized protein n=1 Tax=Staurois parvus TaxID=386267 RepID=A0ABN9EWN8_9NEOB|nr:unnamed protein product [Staurois parvus]
MGTAGVQTREPSTKMVGTPDNRHSRYADQGTQHRDGRKTLIMGLKSVQTQEPSTGMVGTPHNGHSRCSDPGTQHRDGGNPS